MLVLQFEGRLQLLKSSCNKIFCALKNKVNVNVKMTHSKTFLILNVLYFLDTLNVKKAMQIGLKQITV